MKSAAQPPRQPQPRPEQSGQHEHGQVVYQRNAHDFVELVEAATVIDPERAPMYPAG